MTLPSDIRHSLYSRRYRTSAAALQTMEPRLLLAAQLDRVTFGMGPLHESTEPVLEARTPRGTAVEITGEQRRWHKVTLTFQGPTTSETAAVNPFLDYRLDVLFSHVTSGKQLLVPGYFAADGDAANTGASSGNRWRVHFAPEETGTWTYTASFRTGTNVAVNDNFTAGSSAGFFDGNTGQLDIEATNKTGDDLRAKGRLNYVGERYLQFAETGEYFIKQGPDAPENLLAYSDFDGPFANDGQGDQFIKDWGPHIGDWNNGDPTWGTGGNADRGKGLIGALNYLASEGQNAVSFLTMNITGDDKNVFPYLNYSERTRVDTSRMDQWEIAFEHADHLGLYLHFKTQETENDQLLDGGALGTERRLYYRELVARFSHHLALNWNLGEENTNTTQQRQDFAQHFQDLDPYDHNIVIHSFPGQKEQVYAPLLGNASALTGASLQTSNGSFNEVFADTLEWVTRSENAGKPWVVAVDEPGNANDGLVPDNDAIAATNQTNARKNALWGTLMAGGAGNEWYFGYQHDHSDLTLQDFRSRDQWWDITRYAQEFFTQNSLPFWEMENDNSISTATDDYGFKKEGDVYVVYLKNGGTHNLNLSSATGDFAIDFFNPRTGDFEGTTRFVTGGQTVSMGAPPNTTGSDWVVLARRIGSIPQQAFGGTNGTIADGAFLQAEDYDIGGEGVAYHDLDPGNSGDAYRSDDVDVSASTPSGHRVAITTGEWLEYTVDATAGTYFMSTRVFPNAANQGLLRVLIGDGPDGENFEELGIIGIPADANQQATVLTLPDIAIPGGNDQVVRLEAIGAFDIDWLEFTTNPPQNVAPSVTIDGISENQGPGGAFQETNGLLVMEVESAEITGDWELQTAINGFTGDGYYRWEGPNFFGTPGNGVMAYTINIENPGTYQMRIRSHRDAGTADQENDVWARMDNGQWAKVFSGQAGSWVWNSNFDFGEGNRPAASYVLGAGEHTFYLSGRSQGFRIDRIALFNNALTNQAQATQVSNPESPQNGVAGNYLLEATVTDDGRDTDFALQWSQVSGPSSVVFDTPNAEDTGVTIGTEPGTYVFRLTADDGSLITFQDFTLVIEEPTNDPITFNAVDDAFLQNGTPFNNEFLQVENDGRVRTSYLAFDVDLPDNAIITSATLRLTENGDTSNNVGLNLNVGVGGAWTESTITSGNAPTSGALLDTFSGSIGAGQVVELDATAAVTGEGNVEFVLSQNPGTNDVWFGSDESNTPPELIVAYTLPLGPGDFNADGILDIDDLDLLCARVGESATGANAAFDLDNTGNIAAGDVVAWLDLIGSTRGDTNLDGNVDLLDLDALGTSFGTAGTWRNGDFDCNGTVNLLDLNILGQFWSDNASFAPAAATPLSTANGISGSRPFSFTPLPDADAPRSSSLDSSDDFIRIPR